MAVDAKICGLTRPIDAAFAAQSGATYLGVIFAGGARHLTASQAREIVSAAGPVPVFGVFAMSEVPAILAMRDKAGISAVQLHDSGYTTEDVAALRAEGLIVWRVVHVKDAESLAALDEGRDAHAVLVEPKVTGQLGGTGMALNDELAMLARQRLVGQRMVLAGGLTPDTLKQRLVLVGPDVVDVSSGVETSPGVKSPDLVGTFLEVARGHNTRT